MNYCLALMLFLCQAASPETREIVPGDGTALGQQIGAVQSAKQRRHDLDHDYQRYFDEPALRLSPPPSSMSAALPMYTSDYMKAANDAYRNLCDYDDLKAIASKQSQTPDTEVVQTLRKVGADLRSSCLTLSRRRQFLSWLGGGGVLQKCDLQLKEHHIDVDKLLEIKTNQDLAPLP